ncbi:MAG: hypothetical protein HYU64_02145 [Armatimonadetes bacterium]|nr:hypothetical protein [Armatimonadota bacterium]
MRQNLTALFPEHGLKALEISKPLVNSLTHGFSGNAQKRSQTGHIMRKLLYGAGKVEGRVENVLSIPLSYPFFQWRTVKKGDEPSPRGHAAHVSKPETGPYGSSGGAQIVAVPESS